MVNKIINQLKSKDVINLEACTDYIASGQDISIISE